MSARSCVLVAVSVRRGEDLGQRLVQPVHRAPDACVEQPAPFREKGPFPRALEEAAPGLAVQLVQRLGDGGLRHAAALGRPACGSVLHHRKKHPEMPQVARHHGCAAHPFGASVPVTQVRCVI